ncbi:sulfotransferase family 2 domain-containing protein [Temperatibacter marinus]|uniref:Sulfotransferase family 2 domain-containing protein n=1 Tax=Temperatibacter marinus TaxID=1456591 RepID=A0AA52HB23_9PROT|nr:sulfotransferase family 2 domain-containing protein [Temperatibacter marinus]WND03203.1 sulfotransferase family 2 domain-containing protein [Temperatibacter marinus]
MPLYINNKISILYMHIPKTGGAYIEDLLRANSYSQFYWRGKRLTQFDLCTPQHYTLAQLSGVIDLTAITFIFATVRHPYKRLLSEYTMRHPLHDVQIDQWLDEAYGNYLNNPYAYDNHLRPQAEFHQSGTRYYKQEDSFDEKWAFKFENDSSLSLPIKQVPRRKEAKRTHKKILFSDLSYKIRDKYYNLYKNDFKTFNYDPEEID